MALVYMQRGALNNHCLVKIHCGVKYGQKALGVILLFSDSYFCVVIYFL